MNVVTDSSPHLPSPSSKASHPAQASGRSGARDTGYVRLNPPLPCAAPGFETGGLVGFTLALAQDRLLVRFVDGSAWDAVEAGAAPRGELAVTLGDSRTYSFHFELALPAVPIAGEPEALEARISDPVGLARLADLLTLVRKGQHIAICETMDVEAKDRYTGFSDVLLLPKALPELRWDELDTSRQFLGTSFPLPLLITGMTGGLTRGAEINRRLARAAEHYGLPMGVGSQRVALDNPEHAAIFSVKKDAPRVFLIGNLGIAQILARDALDTCKRAVEMIDADALAIHVNVLQEVVQVEGDRDFRGIIDRIHALVGRIGVPVMIKEVGGGIDAETAQQLVAAGVKAIDCGGKGGTSWSYIEGVRAQSRVTQSVADTFRDWGIPTATCVAALRQSQPDLDLVATGGIRDGLTVAKAIALGATMTGVGLPLFRAALADEDEPFEVVETLVQGLKTAMICTGSKSLAALAGRLRTTAAFRERLEAFLPPQRRGELP